MWQRHHKEKKLQSLKKLRTCSKKKRNLVFKWDPQTLFCLKRQMNPMKQRQNSVICSFEYGTLNGLRSKWQVQYYIGFYFWRSRGVTAPPRPPYLRPSLPACFTHVTHLASCHSWVNRESNRQFLPCYTLDQFLHTLSYSTLTLLPSKYKFLNAELQINLARNRVNT